MITHSLENHLLGHNGAVTSLTLSIDRELLVSGSRDNSIIIWKIDSNLEKTLNEITQCYEIKKPEIYKILNGHTNIVQQVLISNDKRFIVSASWDKTVRIWDVGSGECVKIIKGHTKEVMGISLFENGFKKISSISHDKTLMVINFTDWDELVKDVNEIEFVPTFHKTIHNDWITCCKYPPPVSNNFPTCFTAGVDGFIYEWGENLLKTFGYIFVNDDSNENPINHKSCINNIEFSPDASFISSAGEDGNLKLWYNENGENKRKLIYSFDIGSPINQVSFNSINYTCLVACRDFISLNDLISKDCFGKIILKPYDDEDINQLPIFLTSEEEDVDCENEKSTSPSIICLSIIWHSSYRFYAACDDNIIREFCIYRYDNQDHIQ